MIAEPRVSRQSIRMMAWIAYFWGKAQPDPEVFGNPNMWHPLAWHMLDVGAVAQALLAQRPRLRAALGSMLALDDDQLLGFVGVLAAMHDTGKYARAFQAKVSLAGLTLDGGLAEANLQNRHDADGMAIWRYWLADRAVVDRLWQGLNSDALLSLMGASLCHHGEPAKASDSLLIPQFGPGLDAATACRDAVLDLLLPVPVRAPPLLKRQARQATHLLSGLVTVADWIGSTQRWFPYTAPHDDVAAYLEQARAQAGHAVAAAGFTPATVAKGRGFSELVTKAAPPTPLQQWALDVPLPIGPALFILEDVTGAGKTEAAQVLVHRLMAAGRASGGFWAMPTQATANAMYGRQADMLAGLFAETGPRPSLALAHGQARLHPGFRASAKDWGRDETKTGETPADLSASAACAAFLADDRRLALMADVGAGTIDQAVLAVLPSRFSPVRLLGLSEKVIVIDEAHAHDPYVTEEMLTLLRFHCGMGGSAVILSATLTNGQREALARCWQGTAPFDDPAGWIADEMRYPLATAIGTAGIAATAVAPAAWSRRRTDIVRVETPEAVLDGLASTLAGGGCAAWVRNTVDDVLSATDLARARGLMPIIFHSRFAQCDRQAIEAGLMARFGPYSTAAERAGKLVIATQVIEQSLDIDFDQLASDLAPVDLLLQRAGRMRRHGSRKRPAGLGEAMLLLSPAPVADAAADWVKAALPGTAAVYRDHGVLWRTAHELMARGGFSVPDDVRALVEAVHAGQTCPEPLLASSDAAYGKTRVDAALASHQLLKFDEGYAPGNQWDSDLKIATRNIEASTTIRLARRNAAGNITPWAASDGADWQAWALSEVRLSGKLAKAGLQSLPALAEELALITARWGRFERDIPVCVLQPIEACATGQLLAAKGEILQFQYSMDSGLQT